MSSLKNAFIFFVKVLAVLVFLEVLVRLFYGLEVVWLKVISVLL